MKQYYDDFPGPAEVNPVAGAHIDLELENALPYGLRISEEPPPDASQANAHAQLDRDIQAIESFLERTSGGSRLVVLNLDRSNVRAIAS